MLNKKEPSAVKAPGARAAMRAVARAVLLAAAASLLGFFVLYGWGSAPSDFPFFLSTGREICEDGIPYTNPFAIREGLKIVVQQWLWDVAIYRLWQLGGYNAAAGAAIALAALAVWLSSVLWTALWRARGWGEPLGFRETAALPGLSVMAGTLMFALPWSVARPCVATMCFFLGTTIVMERWRASTEEHAWRRLWALPLMVACHMQVHMAMAWLDIAVMLVYCLPEDGRALKRLLAPETRADALRRHLLPAAFAALSVAVMPLNPYGVDGMAYVFNSSGAAAYAGAILEMQGPLSSGDALGWWHVLGIALCSLLPLAVGVHRSRRGETELRLDLSAFSLVSVVAVCLHIRNGWICYVFGVAMWAWALKGLARGGAPARGHGPKLAGVLAAAVPATALALALGLVFPYPSEAGNWNVQANYLDPMLDTIEGEAGGKESVVFCSNWVDFNWLEWRGWKVLVDARPEIWEPGISGCEEHLNCDFFDATGAGQNTFSEDTLRAYIEKNGCEYVLRCSSNSEQPTATEEAYSSIDWLSEIASNGAYTLYKVAL